MKSMFFVAASALAFGLVGCGASTGESFETEESADELAVSALQGDWVGDSGKVLSISFTSEAPPPVPAATRTSKVFRATFDTGVRCITTPCPSSFSASGLYTSTSTAVTLSSYDKPASEFIPFLGTYKYTVKGSTLTMTKSDGTITGTLHKVVKCGTAVCGSGTYCCNPVRSLCAPIGAMCIQ